MQLTCLLITDDDPKVFIILDYYITPFYNILFENRQRK